MGLWIPWKKAIIHIHIDEWIYKENYSGVELVEYWAEHPDNNVIIIPVPYYQCY